MELQRLYSYTRRALDDYEMIQEHDTVAVGISGGKDSLTLLCSLAGLRHFYPVPFELTAITVDLGYKLRTDAIAALCKKLDVPYQVIHTQIRDIVWNEQNQKNPCSICAKLRKGALNDAAVSLGCNKIAYGHHREDMIETMLLSLLFEGRFHTFSPVTHLERTGLTVIRPLMYVPESEVIGFQHKYNLPVLHNPCPADGHTKRKYVKELLRQINRDNPGVKDRMFTAILNGNLYT